MTIRHKKSKIAKRSNELQSCFLFAEKSAIGLTVLYCIEAVVNCAERNLIQRIDSLRTERGWSVSGLALEANLSENTLKHLYKRKTYPTLQTLYRISAALGYPLWQLLAFDNKAYTLSAQERELLNANNRLSPRHRELLLHIANKI